MKYRDAMRGTAFVPGAPGANTPMELLHLATLINRLLYLESVDRERGGSAPGRQAEENAIDWAVRRLCELDPACAKVVEAARARAAQRIAGSGRTW